MTIGEHYRYRMHIHHSGLPIIFRSDRLYQHLATDMFARIEHDRLALLCVSTVPPHTARCLDAQPTHQDIVEKEQDISRANSHKPAAIQLLLPHQGKSGQAITPPFPLTAPTAAIGTTSSYVKNDASSHQALKWSTTQTPSTAIDHAVNKRVFTEGSPVEYKSFLGSKLRIDFCIEWTWMSKPYQGVELRKNSP